MESSQVQCSICSEYLNNNDIIYASTKCGHIYHQKCLNDKFEHKSRICGGRYKCSSICYPRYCRRVYFNFNSYNWVYIKSNIFKQNEIEFEGYILKLGINKNGHNIYAARACLQNGVIKCYYNSETEKIYEDFECSSEYNHKQYELLEISKDNGHLNLKNSYRLERTAKL